MTAHRPTVTDGDAASAHLLAVLSAAARGTLPPRDGVHVIGAPSGAVDAVVSFPFHSIVATSLSCEEVHGRLDPDDPAASLRATFLAWLAERLATTSGSIDVVLAWPEPDTAAPRVPRSLPVQVERRDDLVAHPRVARAMDYRRDVVVAADDRLRAVACAGRGLAGRWEISFELDESLRGHGHGAALAIAAAALAPPGEPVFAQVAPANTTSLRTMLAAGFTPIGAEALFLRRRR